MNAAYCSNRWIYEKCMHANVRKHGSNVDDVLSSSVCIGDLWVGNALSWHGCREKQISSRNRYSYWSLVDFGKKIHWFYLILVKAFVNLQECAVFMSQIDSEVQIWGMWISCNVSFITIGMENYLLSLSEEWWCFCNIARGRKFVLKLLSLKRRF